MNKSLPLSGGTLTGDLSIGSAIQLTQDGQISWGSGQGILFPDGSALFSQGVEFAGGQSYVDGLGNFFIRTSGNAEIKQRSNFGSLSIGTNPEMGGGQIQFFGVAHGSFPARTIIDAGTGELIFRFNSVTRHGPEFLDVGTGVPKDPAIPTKWIKCRLNGADGYISWHAA
jgi:hypothetical protein